MNERALKKVFVDASDRDRLITLVVDGENRARWHSIVSYGKYKIDSDEAEYLGVLCALNEVPGDIEILNDNESVIRILRGESALRKKAKKPLVERIRRLCQNRNVVFSFLIGDSNPAGLKQRGFSKEEIDTPELRDWRLGFEKEMKAKYKERKRKTNESKREREKKD
jgi:hypothetical protein